MKKLKFSTQEQVKEANNLGLFQNNKKERKKFLLLSKNDIKPIFTKLKKEEYSTGARKWKVKEKRIRSFDIVISQPDLRKEFIKLRKTLKNRRFLHKINITFQFDHTQNKSLQSFIAFLKSQNHVFSLKMNFDSITQKHKENLIDLLRHLKHLKCLSKCSLRLSLSSSGQSDIPIKYLESFENGFKRLSPLLKLDIILDSFENYSINLHKNLSNLMTIKFTTSKS